jgi:imidazolonepropionase-like amidohydrolase
MRFVFIIFSLLLLSPPLQSKERSVAIVNINVISGEDASVRPNLSVLLKGEKITDILESDQNISAEDYEIVDGKNKYLIPGLIDSHVHLSMIPGMAEKEIEENPELVKEYVDQLPRSYLYFGYTSVLDMNNCFPEGIRHFETAPLHPDRWSTSIGINVLDGYPMNFISTAKRLELYPNYIYDPKIHDAKYGYYNGRYHDPKNAVDYVYQDAGIAVKTYYEPGNDFTGNLATMSSEMFRELIDAAHSYKLPVFVHAQKLKAQEYVVEFDIDVFAHGIFYFDIEGGEKEKYSRVEKVLDKVVEKGIGYQPTMRVMGGLRDLFESSYLKDPKIAKVVPASLLKWFQSDAGQWYKEDPTAFFQAALERLFWEAAYLDKKNALLLFGTDTPAEPSYGNLPGLNGYLEMKHWCEAGVLLKTIFLAATINNAKVLNKEHRYGSIEKGKIANLLILSKNPLESIEAYDSIEKVILRGKIIERESLAASSSL